MASRFFQDLLQEGLEAARSKGAANIYEDAVNSAFKNIKRNTTAVMNGTSYNIIMNPRTYKGSIDTAVDDFKISELSFSLQSKDALSDINIGATYNNWAANRGVKESINDQYRNMYDYLMNMDRIELTGQSLTDDEIEYVMETGRAARRNKTYQSNNYSGEGAERAINYINNTQRTSTVNTSSAGGAGTKDNSPTGRIKRLLSGKYKDKMIWSNQGFMFGEDFINDEGFRNEVMNYFSNNEGMRNQMLDRLVDITGFSPNQAFYESYNNMFNAYKDLEGLDVTQAQDRIVGRMKELGYNDFEIEDHYRILQEGADFFGWQGSKDFYNINKNQTHQTAPETTTSTTSTGPSFNQGDQYFDPKTKRQYFYEGADEIHGGHKFITDQGRTMVLDTDQVSKLKRNTNPKYSMDFETVRGYRNALDQMNELTRQSNFGVKDPAMFYQNAQDIIKKVKGFEKKVKKKFKYHRMNKDDYTSMKVLQGKIDDFNASNVNTNVDANVDPDIDPNIETNVNPDDIDFNTNTGPGFEGDPSTWTDEYIKQVSDGDPDIANEMINMRNAARNANTQTSETTQTTQSTPETTQTATQGFDPDDPTTWSDEDLENVRTSDPEYYEELKRIREEAIFNKENPGVNPDDPSTWTDDYIDNISEGDPHYYENLNKQRQQAIHDKTFNPDDPTTWTDADLDDMSQDDPYYRNNLERRREQARQQQQRTQRQNQQQNQQTQQQNQQAQQQTQRNQQRTQQQNQQTQQQNQQTQQNQQQQNQQQNQQAQQRQNQQQNQSQTPDFSNIDPDDPSTWTDDYIKHISDGDPDIANEMINKRANAGSSAGAGGGSSTSTSSNTSSSSSTNTGSNTNTNPHTTNYGPRANPQQTGPVPNANQGPIVNPMHNTQVPNGPTASPIIQNAPNGKTIVNSVDDAADAAKKFKTSTKVMSAINVIGAIGDYKDARRKGHGVVSSAVRAGVKFAIDEALGPWAPVVALARMAPGAIIKGADMLYKENRRMNSAANFQVFGDAQFMDTQQLATMRQSGMEMAKMSQYNLQQTLMGSEAKYLHR